jgi:hypothetical protein
MNPLNWRHEHQLALVVGAAVGIAIGLLVGLIYNGIHYATLFQWLGWSWSAVRWAILGALIGGATIYTRQLLHQ